MPSRTHHGFSWAAPRVPCVWSEHGALATADDSVHPPRFGAPWLCEAEQVYEVMYPSYYLGDGDSVERAMHDGLHLAVDVSHVWIQLRHGAMTEATWRRLQEYERVAEVHVSGNDGLRDSHRPMTAATFGIAWARERERAGTLLVIECYMHKLGDGERRRQLDLVRR